MMLVSGRARRVALTAAAALLLPVGALAGLGAAAAQTPPTYYPLFNMVSGSPQGGDLTIATSGPTTTVTIYLQNVIPNITYNVSDCTISAGTVVGLVSTVGCAVGTPATISSDANGNATATVTFQTTTVGTILIADPVNAGDSYEATPSGMPLTAPVFGVTNAMPTVTLLPAVGPFAP